MNRRTDIRTRRLVLMIFYEGPWEKLSNFFIGMRRDTTLRFEIPVDPKGWKWVALKLSCYFEKRDRDWRARYILSETKPSDRWKRRSHESDPEA